MSMPFEPDYSDIDILDPFDIELDLDDPRWADAIAAFDAADNGDEEAFRHASPYIEGNRRADGV